MARTSFYISAIIIFLSFNILIHSQGTWESVVSPTDKLLSSVHFVDSLYGWAVGDSGTIIHTSNGGITWESQNSNTANKIVYVFFLTRNLGWASSWNTSSFPFGTVLLKTTNGGQTWANNPYAEENIFIQSILYIDSLNGWMGGKPHALVRTSDGGVLWEQAVIDTSLLAFFPVSNIHFYDSIYGYACGGAFEAAGVVWRTTNGGNNWFAIDVAFAPPDPIHEIHIFDSLNVLGIGGDFEFFGVGTIRTTDGGLFWEYEDLGIPGVAFDLAFRNDHEAWAPLRIQQTLMYSLDSGWTWIEIPAPDNSAITDLIFPDSLHGFAVGEQGAILKYKPPDMNVSGIFINGSFETGDFTGWITQDIVTPFFPLLVGGAGITPGFNMFLSNPTEGSFAALHGFEGDGPDTIRVAQDVTLLPNSVSLEFDYRAGWDLSGGGGTMDRIFMVNIEPTGGGPSLQTEIILTVAPPTTNFDTGDLHGSVDISSLTDSTVRISFDWYIPESFTGPGFFQLDDVYIEEIIPVELTSLTASTSGGKVTLNWATATETNNSGFEVQRTPLNPPFIKGGKQGEWKRIGFVEGHGTTTKTHSYSYVDVNLGAGKYLYRLKQIDFDGTVDYSSEVSIEVSAPLEFTLEQNYPNPFNPSTNIIYQVPENGNINLKVYDVLGNEVAVLANQHMVAGRYEVEFSAKGGSASGGNASSLPSGVYFYQLKAGSYIETKKMVLLK